MTILQCDWIPTLIIIVYCCTCSQTFRIETAACFTADWRLQINERPSDWTFCWLWFYYCKFSLHCFKCSLFDISLLTLLVLNKFFYLFPSAECIFIFDYLTVILPRQLLSTATARYSTHPLDVDDFCRQPHSTPYVDFGRHQHQKS